jgi:hypothetical protein
MNAVAVTEAEFGTPELRPLPGSVALSYEGATLVGLSAALPLSGARPSRR